MCSLNKIVSLDNFWTLSERRKERERETDRESDEVKRWRDRKRDKRGGRKEERERGICGRYRTRGEKRV